MRSGVFEEPRMFIWLETRKCQRFRPVLDIPLARHPPVAEGHRRKRPLD
jgi:hypothetical protein